MITPINVVQNNCKIIKKFQDINSTKEDILIDNVKNGFEQSPSYTEVIRNFDETTKYKTWIYEGNKVDKIVGYKTLVSYPYEDLKFQVGDFIAFEYGKVPNSTWLIESFNCQHTFDAKGRILECNNILKYRSNNVITSVPCVFMDNVTYTNFSNKGTDRVVEPNAEIIIMTQQNSDTDFVKKNKRFIFNDLVYAVKQTIRSLNSNFLKIMMYEVPQQKEDDFVNGIAWNGEDILPDPKTETLLTPEIYEISEGETQHYEIYRYVDGVSELDTFIITSENVPLDKFSLTIIDGNKFDVRCELAYDKNPLRIKCLNTMTSEVFEYDIWLTGGWI